MNKARYGGFLSTRELESFNNAEFGISENESKTMDKSHKLLLTVSKDALIDIHQRLYSSATILWSQCQKSSVGVFVGAGGIKNLSLSKHAVDIMIFIINNCVG